MRGLSMGVDAGKLISLSRNKQLTNINIENFSDLLQVFQMRLIFVVNTTLYNANRYFFAKKAPVFMNSLLNNSYIISIY